MTTKSIKGSRTEKNLLKAFAGESQARNRYTIFGQVAIDEGYEQIADFFLETAHNEFMHANIFFSFLEGGPLEITATYPAGAIGTTAENLKASADGEHEEFVEIYPEFATIAEEEGYPAVAQAFRNILKIEHEHEKRFLDLWQNCLNNKVFEKEVEVAWVCRECGFTHEGKKAPKVCPTCKAPQGDFEIKATNY